MSGIDAALRPPEAPVYSSLDKYVRSLTLVKGKVAGNATVRLSVDGQPHGTTTASAMGAWEIGHLKLAQGRHALAATASDCCGTSPARKTLVVVDRTKPTVSAPKPASCRSGGTVAVVYAVYDS